MKIAAGATFAATAYGCLSATWLSSVKSAGLSKRHAYVRVAALGAHVSALLLALFTRAWFSNLNGKLSHETILQNVRSGRRVVSALSSVLIASSQQNPSQSVVLFSHSGFKACVRVRANTVPGNVPFFPAGQLRIFLELYSGCEQRKQFALNISFAFPAKGVKGMSGPSAYMGLAIGVTAGALLAYQNSAGRLMGFKENADEVAKHTRMKRPFLE
eukprot:1177080-Prorocentrum_minimum.AAC.5